MKKLMILGMVVACGAANAQLWNQVVHVPGAAGNNGLSAFRGTLDGGTSQYDRQVADDFTVSGGGWNISSVTTNWVQFTPGDPNAVTGVNWAIYNSTGAGVGTLVEDGTTNSFTRMTGPGTYFTRPEEIIVANISPATIGNGDYFMMVQLIVDHNWFWLTASSPAANGLSTHLRNGPASNQDPTWPANWTSSEDAVFLASFDASMRIDGQVVPEPGTFIAIGIGLAGLALARRRK
jgi:hypothetical protein